MTGRRGERLPASVSVPNGLAATTAPETGPGRRNPTVFGPDSILSIFDCSDNS